MKAGVATSSILHAALISWGLLNLSAPEVETFELSGVEIDFETSNVSQPVQGEEEADVTATPAPTPTEKPKPEPEQEAVNIGDAKTDEKSADRENPDERVVEKSATAPEPDQAVTAPEVVPETKPEEAPTPATELAAVNDPATPIVETPPEETPQVPEPSIAEQQIAALPEALPVPIARPRPPKPNTAKTKERKQPDENPAKKSNDAKKADQQALADKILNDKTTEEAASGGQKQSTETASLGSNVSSPVKQLSRREEDQLISHIKNQSTQIILHTSKFKASLESTGLGYFKLVLHGLG